MKMSRKWARVSILLTCLGIVLMIIIPVFSESLIPFYIGIVLIIFALIIKFLFYAAQIVDGVALFPNGQKVEQSIVPSVVKQLNTMIKKMSMYTMKRNLFTLSSHCTGLKTEIPGLFAAGSIAAVEAGRFLEGQ